MRAILSALLIALACLSPAGAQGVLPVPELTARVIDQTGTLDAIQRQGLEDKLAAFEQGKGTQIVVLMVPTTMPEDIAAYAQRVADSWKIGRREVGDGILVVVAKNDRRVRIEVAKALEGAVPDVVAYRIIDEAVTPRFRQNDFAGGLQAAADQLIARVSGEALPEPQQRSRGGAAGGFDWFNLVIFLFVLVPVAGGVLRAVLGRKLGAAATGGGMGLLAFVVTSSVVIAGIAALVALLMALFSGIGPPGGGARRRGGWGAGPWVGTGGWGGSRGGGGSWGGGGGFSSGGGGSFGGGGASGSW